MLVLLGPATNLGWGSAKLGLLLVETLGFFTTLVLFVQARRLELRILLAAVALVVWLASGLISAAIAF